MPSKLHVYRGRASVPTEGFEREGTDHEHRLPSSISRSSVNSWPTSGSYPPGRRGRPGSHDSALLQPSRHLRGFCQSQYQSERGSGVPRVLFRYHWPTKRCHADTRKRRSQLTPNDCSRGSGCNSLAKRPKPWLSAHVSHLWYDCHFSVKIEDHR
jgi:hypothetical protein